MAETTGASKPAKPTATEKEAALKELEIRTSLNKKLLNVQTKLCVPKGQENKFGGYNYRSCEDIEKEVKPLLLENNLTLTLNSDLIEIGGRLFVKAKACLYDNDSGMALSVPAYAELGESKKGMDQAQLTGAATSYARKYALAGLFLIDNEKDPDATNRQSKDEEAPNTINATQIKAINAELERTGISESVILDSVKKKDIKDITQDEYVGLMKRLNASSDK